MRLSLAIFIVPACCLIGIPDAANAKRFGPAEDPEAHDDYGGTPDSTLSDELGLSLDELNTHLSNITSSTLSVRLEAALAIKRNGLGSEQVFRKALWGNHDARNAQIKEAIKAAIRIHGDSNGLLGALLQMDPDDSRYGEGVKAASRIMGMMTALYSLDTMAAYKVMLDFSGRHAGAFRQIIGAMLVERGFNVLPALIYGRGSKSRELHMFCVKWIKDMGNPLLGEQIQGIKNPRRLAQLLEAYASVNELDAIDVTLSLANHESVFVRNAARKCLAVYGGNAKWIIRRAYENTFSKDPENDTSYEQWREALYHSWDKQRLEHVIAKFEKGLAAAADGNYELMDQLYREVLVETPMFSRRNEMGDGYLAYATALEEESHVQKAKEILMLAKRLYDEEEPSFHVAAARLDWLYAEANRKGGAVDVALYRNIIERDPSNANVVKRVNQILPEANASHQKQIKMLWVSILIFAGTLIIYFRIRKTHARSE